jgi:hypothetical protein
MLGGCWFFTVNLLERRKTLLVDHMADYAALIRLTSYVQEVDKSGAIVSEFKDTLGRPNGLLERKWLHGGSE